MSADFTHPTGNPGLKPVRSWPWRSWASQKSLIYFISHVNIQPIGWASSLWSYTVFFFFALCLTLFLTEAVRNKGKYLRLWVVDGSESTTATSLAIIWIIANTWKSERSGGGGRGNAGQKKKSQGRFLEDNFIKSSCLKWCHPFYSLYSIAFLKLGIAILMCSKNITSKVNVWILAEKIKQRAVGHGAGGKNPKWLRVLKSKI